MAYKKVAKKLLGELLVEAWVITEVQLEKALEKQKESGELLGEIIVKLGFATEQDIASVVAVQHSIPYLPVRQCDIDKELLKLVPKEVAVKYRCFPISRIGSMLTIVMGNPLDEKAIGDIAEITRCKVLRYVSTTSEITAAIEEHYERSRREEVEAEALQPEEEGSIRVYQLDNDEESD